MMNEKDEPIERKCRATGKKLEPNDGLSHEVFTRKLANEGVEWKFSPPSVPHFGGVWEQLVKSCKVALEIQLGNQNVQDEMFRTVIADVEALLNACPLTHVSIDVNDLEPITPNHFLYGRAIEYKPVIDSTNSSETASRQRIERVQALVQSAWERWMTEYLPNLIERKKWQIHRESLKIGDIVLVIQDNTPRGKWPLGRVIEVISSEDGLIRSANVKIGDKMYRRPVAKLCMLEIDSA